MTQEAGFGRRGALTLLLLCVVVFTQAAALSWQHEQHRPSDHCCVLCHAGLAALLAPDVPAAAPAAPGGWLASGPDSEPAHEVLLAAGFSRAPPA